MEVKLKKIKQQLQELEAEMDQVPQRFKEILTGIHPTRTTSATNLLKYLVLRKTDIQNLQENLHLQGLSSLASCESHTQFQIQATLERLGEEFPKKDESTKKFGAKKIEEASEVLFGNAHQDWILRDPNSVWFF